MFFFLNTGKIESCTKNLSCGSARQKLVIIDMGYIRQNMKVYKKIRSVRNQMIVFVVVVAFVKCKWVHIYIDMYPFTHKYMWVKNDKYIPA